MPIEVYWYLDKRVSYFKYSGVITVEDLQQSAEIGRQLLDSSDAPLVHSIQDSGAITEFPRNLYNVHKITNESLTHPRMGWLISTGINDQITRFVAEMLSKVTKHRQRFVITVDEALTFLNEVDASLPDLKSLPRPTAMVHQIGAVHPEEHP